MNKLYTEKLLLNKQIFKNTFYEIFRGYFKLRHTLVVKTLLCHLINAKNKFCVNLKFFK